MTIREAARVFDVSRPTLAKRIKDGRLSATPTEGGGWLIDPAEMVRAGYLARQEGADDLAKDGQHPSGQLSKIASAAVVKDELTQLRVKLAEAEQRAAVAEALAQERAERIEDLRRMLPAPAAQRRRWWPWSG